MRDLVAELSARHALPKEVVDGVTERTGGAVRRGSDPAPVGAWRAGRHSNDPADVTSPSVLPVMKTRAITRSFPGHSTSYKAWPIHFVLLMTKARHDSGHGPSSRVSSFAAVQGTAAAELFSHKAKPPLTIPEHL